MAPIPIDQMSPFVTLFRRKITKQKKTKGGNLPKPALIAIVVVVVVLLVIAIVLPIIQKRRKARREAKRDTAVVFSQQDSEGLYPRMSGFFGGLRTGGIQQQFQGPDAYEKQHPMDGGTGHQGVDYNAYGSGGPGSDGRGAAGYYIEGQYSQNHVMLQRPPKSFAFNSPPARPLRV